jgi:hypothetical protein
MLEVHLSVVAGRGREIVEVCAQRTRPHNASRFAGKPDRDGSVD